MTDPDAVARALSRLATGSAATVEPHCTNSERPSPTPERVVADAEASMERVDRAAAFLVAGGESRLRWAIQCADASDDELAARGRAVVTALAAFRAAASDGDERCEHPSSSSRTTSTAFAQRSSGGES